MRSWSGRKGWMQCGRKLLTAWSQRSCGIRRWGCGSWPYPVSHGILRSLKGRDPWAPSRCSLSLQHNRPFSGPPHSSQNLKGKLIVFSLLVWKVLQISYYVEYLCWIFVDEWIKRMQSSLIETAEIKLFKLEMIAKTPYYVVWKGFKNTMLCCMKGL